MREHYETYHRRFTAEAFERFAGAMERAVGHRYRVSTTPFFLSRQRFERLAEITEAVVKLLAAPAYHREVMASDWFLPQHPMRPHDYFGDVEFHLSDEEEKIIEINFNPPGHVGLLELLEQTFLDAFDIETSLRLNQGFERAFVEAVTEGGRFRKIAIAVNHLPMSAPYYPHYKYFEKIFARHDIAARVVYARDVEFDGEGWPVWDGERFERIFNLLIVRIWEDHPEEFANYSLAFARHPRMFFLNPLGWKLGSKAFLKVCGEVRRREFGLSDREIELIERATLPTRLLSEFNAPEEIVEYFGEGNFVLKPLDDYHVKGVAIRPGMDRIKPIFETKRERYIAQAYFAPGKLPAINFDGTVSEKLFSLRMGFLNGRAFGARGYTFTSPATTEELAPVICAA